MFCTVARFVKNKKNKWMISQKHEKKEESFVKIFLRKRWILASFDLWNNYLKQCIESFQKNHPEICFAYTP